MGRVLGLETEYLVSFVPIHEDPPRWLLLTAVEEAIVRVERVCTAESGGYFLANGGAVSFESRFERRELDESLSQKSAQPFGACPPLKKCRKNPPQHQ